MSRIVLTVLLASVVGATLVAYMAPKPGPELTTAAVPVGHVSYDGLLKEYVNDKGLVDQGVERLPEEPEPVSQPAEQQPASGELEQRLQRVIKLTLNHYSVESIKDIGSKIKFPLMPTPWTVEFSASGVGK